ncbi:hypothetical protein F5X68DRAFT_63869 [Plectosphaerella plurivora]|uniref:Uncharacterized protein n=1 Tax=Plectosphaerella plurivora TaxID=936078 RepID=A0A9P8V0L9_9PEZI|nr:hypothetical protein F5X68DRAFT_63869 [Plectosphaerella plurivora]
MFLVSTRRSRRRWGALAGGSGPVGVDDVLSGSLCKCRREERELLKLDRPSGYSCPRTSSVIFDLGVRCWLDSRVSRGSIDFAPAFEAPKNAPSAGWVPVASRSILSRLAQNARSSSTSGDVLPPLANISASSRDQCQAFFACSPPSDSTISIHACRPNHGFQPEVLVHPLSRPPSRALLRPHAALPRGEARSTSETGSRPCAPPHWPCGSRGIKMATPLGRRAAGVTHPGPPGLSSVLFFHSAEGPKGGLCEMGLSHLAYSRDVRRTVIMRRTVSSGCGDDGRWPGRSALLIGEGCESKRREVWKDIRDDIAGSPGQSVRVGQAGSNVGRRPRKRVCHAGVLLV